MRSSTEAIRRIVAEAAGANTARIRLFGSRVHDEFRGGDLDLLVEFEQPVTEPAMLAARMEARIIRYLAGREVDVVLAAPNLRRVEIHRIAEPQGVLL